MPNPNKRPLDPEPIASELDGQPENVRELFRYALVRRMVEEGKAKIIETQHIDALKNLTFKTITIAIGCKMRWGPSPAMSGTKY